MQWQVQAGQGTAGYTRAGLGSRVHQGRAGQAGNGAKPGVIARRLRLNSRLPGGSQDSILVRFQASREALRASFGPIPDFQGGSQGVLWPDSRLPERLPGQGW